MAGQSIDVIKRIAPKLGINNDDVINQAFDYIREVNTKSKLAFNEMLKIAICLDLATTKIGGNFDKAAALKLAVINKTQYQKNYLLIKNVLQVENKKTIKEICIQLSCEEVSKLAEKLLIMYKEQDTINRDFSHPQYEVAAVWTCCSLSKISVKKSDFVNLSTLKPNQWIKLEQEFLKFAEENNFKCDTINRTKKRGNDFLETVEKKSLEIEKENALQKEKSSNKNIESYEVWRKRILEEAYMITQKK